MSRAAALAVALLLAAAATARAAPGPRGLSASRDAPVFELAYGPRAQLSVGHEVTLAEGGGAVPLGLAFSALAALENAASHSPVPEELARVVLELSFSASLASFARARLGEGGALILGARLGLERAGELRDGETDRPLPEPRPGDIAFGGGGAWLGLDVTLRLRLGARHTLSLRAAERVFTNGLPLLFGFRAESDAVADFIGEGLAHAPSLDATYVWAATPSLRPLASLFAEGLLPHDRSADAGGFARLLLGVALPWRGGELLPFVSVDAGSGKGMLVNRHELRLSVGVRHAF